MHMQPDVLLKHFSSKQVCISKIVNILKKKHFSGIISVNFKFLGKIEEFFDSLSKKPRKI